MNRLIIKTLKNICCLLILAVCCSVTPAELQATQPYAPPVSARAAILLDVCTGRVFYAKDADSRVLPASTTKILTLITALSSSVSGETVTISANAAKARGASCNLLVGEQYLLTDLYYAMMLESGNDAAVAVAEHTGGSVQRFVEMMNAKAEEVGVRDSSFVNPTGLTATGHYTTARDMSAIARYAMKYPAFTEIVGTKYKNWGRNNDRQPPILQNTNELLFSYEYATGVKTGYTQAARRCLVASAKHNGLHLLVVLFDSEPYCWNDARALLDYGFSVITPRLIYKKDSVVTSISVYDLQEEVQLVIGEDLILPLVDDYDRYTIEFVLPEQLSAPVSIRQEVGVVKVSYDGQEIRRIKLFTNEEISGA